MRPDGVFTVTGPIEWSKEPSSVVLFYGSVGDDPSTYLEHTVPLYDKPYIALTESTQASPFRGGAGSYVPPEGSLFIAPAEQAAICSATASKSASMATARARFLPPRTP